MIHFNDIKNALSFYSSLLVVELLRPNYHDTCTKIHLKKKKEVRLFLNEKKALNFF